MKTMNLFLAGLPIVLFAAAPAMAATNPSNWYLGLSGDVTWLKHSDTGGGGNVALGYNFPTGPSGAFRLEAEAGYHGASGDDGFGGTHYFTYMGNAYYDFNKKLPTPSEGWNISPYIGAGLGDAAINNGHSSFSNTFHHHVNSFAWQGMAGLNFTSGAMPNTDWSIGYRYLGTDKENLHASNLELGARFHF